MNAKTRTAAAQELHDAYNAAEDAEEALWEARKLAQRRCKANARRNALEANLSVAQRDALAAYIDRA